MREGSWSTTLPNKRIKLARSKLYGEARSVSARSLCAVR